MQYGLTFSYGGGHLICPPQFKPQFCRFIMVPFCPLRGQNTTSWAVCRWGVRCSVCRFGGALVAVVGAGSVERARLKRVLSCMAITAIYISSEDCFVTILLPIYISSVVNMLVTRYLYKYRLIYVKLGRLILLLGGILFCAPLSMVEGISGGGASRPAD